MAIVVWLLDASTLTMLPPMLLKTSALRELFSSKMERMVALGAEVVVWPTVVIASRAVVAVKMAVFTILDSGKRWTEWKKINWGEFQCSVGITPLYICMVAIVAPS